MQIHKANEAGVTDKPYDPVTPEARAKDAAHKLRKQQFAAYHAALEQLTKDQLADMWENAKEDQRAVIEDVYFEKGANQ